MICYGFLHSHTGGLDSRIGTSRLGKLLLVAIVLLPGASCEDCL
jgi:hypothetical protein